MLDVFAMLGDESRAEFVKLLAELGDDFGPDKIFHGLFGARFGKYVDVELDQTLIRQVIDGGFGKIYREHTTYSSSSVSCAASGMVMEPLTLTFSVLLIVPVENKSLPQRYEDSSDTFIFQFEHHIKKGDDFSFPLANIHVSLHAHQL